MNKNSFWLTRLFYLRGLGFIYFVIGLILFWQGPDLIGPQGLTPVSELVEKLRDQGRLWEVFLRYPSALFFNSSPYFIRGMALFFIVLSILLMVARTNGVLLLILWFLQLSLVNGAGLFWGFGWETMMLEMTFLSLFLVHPWRWNLLSPRNTVPTYWMLWPLLWMMFRLMLGAGLIKIRGDSCWRDFTCMDYHYQTQPNPHPLSWFYHHLPKSFHRFEVVMTHFYELLIPLLFLLPTPFRRAAGCLIVFFQLTLISTGNLAYLNWQTIVLAFVALDDALLMKMVFQKTKEKWLLVRDQKPSLTQSSFAVLLVSSVLILSYRPMTNMISPQQRMNESYDGFHFVNSYGLFGSITKTRYEVVISGTADSELRESSSWQEYEFKCKPGDPARPPCWITPYHLRLDWQMWFSAMRPRIQEPWLVNLAKKMLENHPLIDRQLAKNPFSGESAPHFVKMDLYQYEFDSEGQNWWRRQWVQNYMPPLSLKNFVQEKSQ